MEEGLLDRKLGDKVITWDTVTVAVQGVPKGVSQDISSASDLVGTGR